MNFGVRDGWMASVVILKEGDCCEKCGGEHRTSLGAQKCLDAGRLSKEEVEEAQRAVQASDTIIRIRRGE